MFHIYIPQKIEKFYFEKGGISKNSEQKLRISFFAFTHKKKTSETTEGESIWI